MSRSVATGFAPGAGVGMVSESLLVLIERSPGAPMVELSESVAAGGGLDDVLELLAEGGLRALGSLAVAAFEGDSLRVVVRGDARVTVTSTEVDEVDGAGLRTWNERLFEHWDAVVVSLGPADDTAEYWVDGGTVPAAVLARPATTVQSALTDDIVIATVPDMSGLSTFADSAVRAPDPEDVAVVSDAGTESSLTVDVVPGHVASPDPAPESVPADVGQTRHNVASDDEEEATPATGSGYDALYGHTVHRSVQGAAMSVPDAASGAGDNLGSLGDHDGYTMSLAQLRALQEAEAAAVGVGDHDGHTLSAAQFAALRSVSPVVGPPTAPPSGIFVQALVCAAGHPNPTHLTVCDRCGGLLRAEQVTIPRPVLGRLLLSTGDVIELDRPVLIGRNPKVEQGVMSELPRIVRLAAFEGVSRSHAMVRLEGWQVLVVDLGSSNHTVVTLPDREPRRLHANEPMLITHGASIDFGGEVTATYDAHG